LTVTQEATLVDHGPWKRRWSALLDALLLCVTAVFFYTHGKHAIVDGSFTSVFFAIEQGLLIGIIVARRRPKTTSTRWTEWLVAALGGWLPLVLRPSGSSSGDAQLVGAALQALGLTGTMFGFSYLGRSFGVVAADRGLKVRGPYRLVRHPIYLSHSVTLAGFLVANFQSVNLALVCVIMTCQLLRIRSEERVLSHSADYDAYRANVRWRLVPGLY
jgi:protein-S-isoprenylcysteine O-methyltransferase Ste14